MTDQSLSQLCDQVRELLPRVTDGKWRVDGLGIRTQRGTIAECPRPQEGGVFEIQDNLRAMALAPTMAAALLKLREERDAAVTAVREMVTANAENMRLAASAEHKLQLIGAVFDATSIPDGLRLKRVHAIATSGKGD